MSKFNGNPRQDSLPEQEWQETNAQSFWGNVASTDHVIQVYEDDEVLITSVATFVTDGIEADETCVIVLTSEHISALDKRLEQEGLNVQELIKEDRYIRFDAEETLAKFMIDDWPDSPLLYLTASEIMAKARARGRKIRCMGEMVYLLWSRGLKAATIQLEAIWNEIYEQSPFLIYCVYRRDAFDGDPHNDLSTICCAHHKIIAGTESKLGEVTYRGIDRKKRESRQTLLEK